MALATVFGLIALVALLQLVSARACRPRCRGLRAPAIVQACMHHVRPTCPCPQARIQMRVPEYGWTTQKVFHLLNALFAGGRAVTFAFFHRIAKQGSPAVQDAFWDLPGIVFFTTYSLLVLFWAEIFRQARSLPVGHLRPAFTAINLSGATCAPRHRGIGPCWRLPGHAAAHSSPQCSSWTSPCASSVPCPRTSTRAWGRPCPPSSSPPSPSSRP